MHESLTAVAYGFIAFAFAVVAFAVYAVVSTVRAERGLSIPVVTVTRSTDIELQRAA